MTYNLSDSESRKALRNIGRLKNNLNSYQESININLFFEMIGLNRFKFSWIKRRF